MIDIHAHILPGLDDGAENLRETLEMACIAVENGIDVMIATPHCNIPDVYENYFDEKLIKTFQSVQAVLEEEEIPLQLLLGMEVYATPDMKQLLAEKKLLPLNNSRYLLVEFPFEGELEFLEETLQTVLDAGLRPIIAHAERYECIQADVYALDKWKERGVLIQVNKASLVGKFGKRSYETAHIMMRRRMVDVIASDCHRPYHRTPVMMDVYMALEKQYPRSYLELLFHDNPEKICRDQEVWRW